MVNKKIFLLCFLKTLSESLENQKPVYQNLLVSSETLIGVCHELSINNDIVMVSSGTEEVKRRWEAFTEKVQSQEKELKNSNKTLALVSDISHLAQGSF